MTSCIVVSANSKEVCIDISANDTSQSSCIIIEAGYRSTPPNDLCCTWSELNCPNDANMSISLVNENGYFSSVDQDGSSVCGIVYFFVRKEDGTLITTYDGFGTNPAIYNEIGYTIVTHGSSNFKSFVVDICSETIHTYDEFWVSGINPCDEVVACSIWTTILDNDGAEAASVNGGGYFTSVEPEPFQYEVRKADGTLIMYYNYSNNPQITNILGYTINKHEPDGVLIGKCVIDICNETIDTYPV